MNNQQKTQYVKQEVIFGDCQEELKKMQPSSVDLIVTSPPYNAGKSFEAWDGSQPLKDYLKFTENWLRECHRVLNEGGIICLNLPSLDRNRILYHYLQIMEKLGLKLQTNIVWVKWDSRRSEKFSISHWRLAKYGKVTYNPPLILAYEFILVMQKGVKPERSAAGSDLTSAEFKDWKYNVWFIAPVIERAHPVPYPIELTRRLIKLYSLPCDLVLDPFVGSGTTAVACKILNRNFIGFDIEQKFISMSEERLKAREEVI